MKRCFARCTRLGVLLAILALAANAEDGLETSWDTTLSLGLSGTRGNSETLTFNGELDAAREWGRQELRVGIEGSYSEAESDDTGESETTAQDARASLRYKYSVRPRWYVYTDDSILHDEPAGLDYRLIAGVGAGRFLLDGQTARLSVEVGAAYIREEFSDGGSDDAAAPRLGVRYDLAPGGSAKVWAAAEYLPQAGEWDAYLLNGEAGIEAVVNSRISLRTVLQDRYDSVPPDDRKHNDISIVGSLVFKL